AGGGQLAGLAEKGSAALLLAVFHNRFLIQRCCVAAINLKKSRRGWQRHLPLVIIRFGNDGGVTGEGRRGQCGRPMSPAFGGYLSDIA
ncbi:hypothetical protein, partial [Serratia rubidaea]|uniref:hypothetical protein n=1 Tax=Serratia rubidaea TaxID=61652 RepID=UPI001F321B57